MTGTSANPWRGLIVLLTLAHIVGTVGYISVMAMAPLIREDLGLNATQIGSFMSAFYFALALGAMPAGMWADRIGVARALTYSMGLMAMGAAGFAMVDSYPAAVAATFTMGLGYGLVNPATAKGVLEGFGDKERATAMGVKQMGVPIGGLLASAVGAGTIYYGWREALFGAAIVTVLVGVAWWLRRGPKPAGRVAGTPSPWADMRAIFANTNMRVINFAGFNFNMSQQSMSTYLTLFLRDVAGANQQVASICLGVAQVAGASGRVLWALISDRRANGRRKGVLMLMMALGTGACLLSTMVGPAWPAVLLAGLAALGGVTILAYAPMLHTICAEVVEPRLAGSAIGSNLLATSIGGTIGPLLFGALVDWTGGYEISRIVTGLIIALGVIAVSLGLREKED